MAKIYYIDISKTKYKVQLVLLRPPKNIYFTIIVKYIYLFYNTTLARTIKNLMIP